MHLEEYSGQQNTASAKRYMRLMARGNKFVNEVGAEINVGAR
jgi:hypothetical protein